METFIKADIFFFVTTIAIVILTLLLSVLLMYGIFAVRNFFKISKDVKKEADSFISTVRKVRGIMENKGELLIGIATHAFNYFKDRAEKPNKKKTKK